MLQFFLEIATLKAMKKYNLMHFLIWCLAFSAQFNKLPCNKVLWTPHETVFYFTYSDVVVSNTINTINFTVRVDNYCNQISEASFVTKEECYKKYNNTMDEIYKKVQLAKKELQNRHNFLTARKFLNGVKIFLRYTNPIAALIYHVYQRPALDLAEAKLLELKNRLLTIVEAVRHGKVDSSLEEFNNTLPNGKNCF